MHTAHHELNKYGIRRLRKIASFIRYGGRGAQALMDSDRYYIENNVTKDILVERISTCGLFERIEQRFEYSWDKIISDIIIDPDLVYGFCNLFGIEADKIYRTTSNIKLGALILIQKLVNKLSTVFVFPGDPNIARCRKRLNDIRLNTLSRSNVFGREPMAIAREISSFQDAIRDPILRIIFWSNYKPGTGQFKVSVSNLDQVIDQEECCSICLENLDSLTPGIKMKPCGHVFHPRCVQDLILSVDRTVLCPMCRTEISDFENSHI